MFRLETKQDDNLFHMLTSGLKYSVAWLYLSEGLKREENTWFAFAIKLRDTPAKQIKFQAEEKW